MNRNRENNRLLIGIIGGAALIVLTMITAIFLVSRRPVVVIVPSGAGSSGVVAPPVGSPPGTSAGPTVTAAPPVPEISVSRIASTPSTDDPLDPAWDKVAIVEVDLAPQQVAAPGLEKGSVPKLRVQAIRDDTRYVWRLSWDKAEIADQSDVAQFTDAVAMQFPLVDGAPYTMGGPGMAVRMLYWKATWQKDVDKGFQGLSAIHPNTDSDLYWFSKGEREHAADGSIDNPQAKQFMVAAQAGNPMIDLNRKSPIEEMTAHGFGSSTHVPDSPSRGRGVWKDGKWYVVIDRPINTKDPLITRFNSSPDKQLIAFAVWDGTNANRGGRKQITNWLPMRITL